MTRLSRLTLIFAIAFAVLLIAPALFAQQFGLYPLMKTGDVIDLLTPLVLIPLYWLLLRIDPKKPFGVSEMIVFLVLASMWVEGQGMHLSANSIGHLLESTKDTDVYTLTHFYDETLSHYLWHSGMVVLTVLLLWRQWRYPFIGEQSTLRWEIAAGVIYGITYFIIVTEAGTASLGLPFAILVTLFGAVWGRARLRQQPVLAFFFVAHALALLLFIIWMVNFGGRLPQFSEVGLI